MIRILIADDIAENRYLLETLLKGNGYEVISATNGVEALELARTSLPDLIITDILMPVMDGFVLCKQWKGDEQLKRIPFVFYTATYTEPKDEEFALSLGAERFIIKPQRPEEIIELLRGLLADAHAGTLAASDKPQKGDEEFFRDHNAALLRKLEKKMGQLEQANEALKQEIVERKRIENELLYRNTILATQQETSLDAILVVDETGKIVSHNNRFIELWGVPEDILAQKSDEQALGFVLDKIAEPGLFSDKVKYLYDHKTETSRDLIRLKDGRIFDRYSSPIVGDGVRYFGRVWYFRDITGQEILEEQLRQAQKMEAIGALAGGVAHDFNNLLAAIMGYACILQKKLASHDGMKTYIDQILQATQRGAGLTKSLLAFSRKQPMELRPVNINEIILGFQKMMNRLIGDDMEFTVTCAGEALMVEADAGQLEQVLMNLITNARDAMPNGGKLTMASERIAFAEDQEDMPRGLYAVITVADTGSGMDKDAREHIFEPFFTTKEIGKGTGLGLAIVYGIVRKHSGFIRVQSEPGKGATFRIYFPLTGHSAREVAKEEQKILPSGTETILLVEDNPNVRFATKDMLQELGYTVLEAADGKEALSVFERNKERVHLVLCDLILPKKNGKEAFEDIRKMKPEIKAIFTSGYAADILEEKGLMDEGIHFLSKPVSMMDLSRKIREALGS